MDTGKVVYSSALELYRLLRSNLYYGLLHLPIGRAKHRALLRSANRDDHHTYTCFYRSPPQLEALTGPVVEDLRRRGIRNIDISVFAASNGAEAYTIAAELMHHHPDLDFTIRGSDLHRDTVEAAREGSYPVDELSQVPRELIERAFDLHGDRCVVKQVIRERVTFEQADLLATDLATRFPPADIVFAQNVLFHLPPDLARRAFENVLQALKPDGWLFLEGMELDMRVELTRRAGLEPLDYKVREIYRHARRHVPENWWDYYYGSEPYSPFAADRLRRYATIFARAASAS